MSLIDRAVPEVSLDQQVDATFAAMDYLAQRGVTEIDEVRIDLDRPQRETMIELTGRRTVPQIFIGNAHIGGCDDLYALDQRGGLTPMLQGSD